MDITAINVATGSYWIECASCLQEVEHVAGSGVMLNPNEVAVHCPTTGCTRRTTIPRQAESGPTSDVALWVWEAAQAQNEIVQMEVRAGASTTGLPSAVRSQLAQERGRARGKRFSAEQRRDFGSARVLLRSIPDERRELEEKLAEDADQAEQSTEKRIRTHH